MSVYRFAVVVTLKPSLLDPQGETVRGSLPTMGWTNVTRVRVGKHVELELEAADTDAALEQVERIAAELLSNPVIEDYRIEALEGAERA